MPSDTEVTIGGFQATFTDVRLPVGLVVSKVVLDSKGASLDQHPFRISLVEPGNIEARVNEKALADFLDKRSPGGLKDFVIQIRDNKLFVHASVRVLVEVRASAVCTLRLMGGTSVYVDLESVELFGVGARTLVQNQLDQINPVLDVASFPLKIEILDVQATDGEIVIRGHAEPLPA